MNIDRSKLKERARRTLVQLEPAEQQNEAAPKSEIDLVQEIEYGAFWSREGLALQDRLVASLTSSCLMNLQDRVRKYSRAALHNDLSPVEIREIFLQAGIYGGFAVTEAAINSVSDLLGEQRELLSEAMIEIVSRAETTQFRQDLHGERHQDSYADPSRKLAGELYEIASGYGYGVIWRRPGLSMRRRFICALAGFTALGIAPQSLKKFALSARDFGLSIEEIRETVVQTAPVCGFPKALQALMILEATFAVSDASESSDALSVKHRAGA